jgi:calcineurin-like phosphoesterase family protein
MTNFVIADLHFGDEALCGREGGRGRPFASVGEMKCAIVDRWNSTVTDDDVIYVLGDVGRGRHAEAVRQLRGIKHLIAGNGDDIGRIAASGLFRTIAVAKWLPLALITHIPVHASQLRAGTLNVHGHLHLAATPDSRFRCVSVEQTEYRPVKLTSLLSTSQPRLI